MKGSTFKRCGCRDSVTGRRLGRSCPQLRRPGGGWSRTHGHWHWQIEIPARADGTRRTLRHGPYTTQADADAVLDRIRAALAVPDPTDPHTTITTGDLIETAVKTGAPHPHPEAGPAGATPRHHPHRTAHHAGVPDRLARRTQEHQDRHPALLRRPHPPVPDPAPRPPTY